MPESQLLVVCESSSLDRFSNSWSLFQLFDRATVKRGDASEAEPPPVAVMQIHVFWFFKPDEAGAQFEFRLVFVRPDCEFILPRIFEMTGEDGVGRYRIRGFPISFTGRGRLMVEWRVKGSDSWTRSSIFWPLEIVEES